jgi:hypothetical protein
MVRKLATKQSATTTEQSGQGTGETTYRFAVACMARTLVADLFDHHQTCTLRECRAAGRCLACGQGGFCPVEMDSRQAFVFAGMMAFHDFFRVELLGNGPTGIETGAQKAAR